MTEERDTDPGAPTIEERVELATVNAPGGVALIFAAVAGAILAAVFWITGTPRRWIALLIAGALGVAVFFMLKK